MKKFSACIPSPVIVPGGIYIPCWIRVVLWIALIGIIVWVLSKSKRD